MSDTPATIAAALTDLAVRAAAVRTGHPDADASMVLVSEQLQDVLTDALADALHVLVQPERDRAEAIANAAWARELEWQLAETARVRA